MGYFERGGDNKNMDGKDNVDVDNDVDNDVDCCHGDGEESDDGG